MIDTIVFRIHNLKKYETTVNSLYRTDKTAKAKIATSGEDNQKTDLAGLTQMVYFDTGKFIRLDYRNTLTIGSHHYFLGYSINQQKDYIEFNFSLPKYKYGTNLVQFINYFDQSAEKQFSIFIDFVNEFFNSPFFTQKVDLFDVELNRIDLCYNQIFPSKDDAIQYFRHQAQKIKKHTFKNQERVNVRGDETLDVVTRRYSFKVYHKGAEFAKHDYKKLVKNNPKGYDLNQFQSIADRTLRYEVTIRRSLMNYFFQKMYMNPKSDRARGGIYKFIYGTLRMDGLTNKEFKSKQFRFQSKFDFYKEYKKRDGENWPLNFKNEVAVTFDYNMFKICFDFFWSYVRKIQVDNTTSWEVLRQKLGIINDGVNSRNMLRRGEKERLRNIANIMLYATFSQYLPLSDLFKQGIISRSTYFNRLKDFKKVGLSDYNPDVALIRPSLDYQEYKYLFANFH